MPEKVIAVFADNVSVLVTFSKELTVTLTPMITFSQLIPFVSNTIDSPVTLRVLPVVVIVPEVYFKLYLL